MSGFVHFWRGETLSEAKCTDQSRNLQTMLQIIRITLDNHSHCRHIYFVIHCICNNINTAKVEAAAAQGAETAACVQRACGTRFNCGQCRTDIDARLMAWRAMNTLPQAAE